MNWLVPALIAPAIYAACIFIDKYVVGHKVKDSRGVPIYSAIAALVFGTSLWLVSGMPVLVPRDALLLIASGIFAVWALTFYFYALSRSHASYVNAAFQTMPVFLLIIAVVFLGERLNILQIVGFTAVLASVVGLSLEDDGGKLKLNKSLYAMLASSFLFAISAVIIKFTSSLDSFVSIMTYESWGLAVGGLILFITYKAARNAFLESFRTVGRSTLSVLFLNEALFIGSKALTFLAITLGPVTLVGVLEGTQVFYGILIGVVLTLLFPKFFHENIGKKDIASKVALCLVLFIGVWCISRA